MGVISKIILTGKGNYDASATYNMLDYVRYSNCTWVAGKTVTGIAPPSDPTVTSTVWHLLCEDGQYLGQYPNWSDVGSKPFDSISQTDFTVVNNELSVVFPDSEWTTVDNKPFDTLSNSFTANNDELDIKVDGTTIYKLSDGTLVANASSMGFDIHSLQEETTLSNNDEFPFYDASASGTRKTLWSNIVSKLNAIFTKVYDTSSNVISNTTIKDSISDLNSSTSANQLAGALAVKSIYQNIAPLPTNAPTYSASKTYSVGDVVKYNSVVYYCKTAITSGEVWNSSKWQAWNDNIQIRFGINADGEYGFYKAGADSVTPFSNGKLKRVLLGSIRGTNQQFNIKTLYPDIDYKKLTDENFAIVQTGTNTASGSNYVQVTTTRASTLNTSCTIYANSGNPYLNYSPSTGILTASSSYVYGSGSATSSGAATGGATYTTECSGSAAYDLCAVYFYYIGK